MCFLYYRAWFVNDLQIIKEHIEVTFITYIHKKIAIFRCRYSLQLNGISIPVVLHRSVGANTAEIPACKLKLVIKENLLIEPAIINVHTLGQLEGFTHQASLIYLHPTTEVKSLSELVNEVLSKQNGIVFGVTAAPVNGLIIRILGHKAEQLHDCLKMIGALLPQSSKSKKMEHAV